MSIDTNRPLVCIVDDDEAMRNSLQWLLEAEGYLTRLYSTAQTFLDDLPHSDTGLCVLLDVRMPGMHGLELQNILKQREFAFPIIIITGHGSVPMAVRALKVGAFDFIEKPFDDELLLNRIEIALRQEQRDRLTNEMRAEAVERIETLTRRELEVMHLVTSGHSNKDISSALGVSTKTVEAHRAHMMGKMQADSLAELVRMVVLAEKVLAKK